MKVFWVHEMHDIINELLLSHYMLEGQNDTRKNKTSEWIMEI